MTQDIDAMFDRYLDKEIAEYLEIRQDSFYSWLKGYYSFSIDRKEKLKGIIDTLRED